MATDHLYRRPQTPVAAFSFNAAVADVFDDMIRRSVPLYDEIIRRQSRLVERYHQPDTQVYDLGCSTGNLTMRLIRRMPQGSSKLVAVDSSRPMLDILRRRLEKSGRSASVTLLCTDIRQMTMAPASVVVVNFTLQFIPAADRDALIQRIYDALRPGGILLFSEKTVHADATLADLQVDFHHRFKRQNGYSALEISQKREALENVLVPESVTAHNRRLKRCGFQRIDIWLKWFNFCSWIGFK
jgi:tRNA (cmo5U34)-methyltransferase